MNRRTPKGVFPAQPGGKRPISSERAHGLLFSTVNAEQLRQVCEVEDLVHQRRQVAEDETALLLPRPAVEQNKLANCQARQILGGGEVQYQVSAAGFADQGVDLAEEISGYGIVVQP